VHTAALNAPLTELIGLVVKHFNVAKSAVAITLVLALA
jgi:hypothetical protein